LHAAALILGIVLLGATTANAAPSGLVSAGACDSVSGGADHQAGTASSVMQAAVPQGQRSNDGRDRSEAARLTGTWMWWLDADVKRELGLSDQKAQRIDEMFQNRQKLLTPMASDFLKEKAVLDRMTAERTADDGTYALQVWRVEALRSKLNESRLMMLYRIYRELQPDQYKKLQVMSDRKFDADRARSGSGR
jgi:hypothetical protein